ncbi:DMT family transporter [Streptomyces boninensis]|uniref:DMT family transporter n=1 Tax=Streptomyces boninensis TaxID=2039455 RepID=UPI003B21034F
MPGAATATGTGIAAGLVVFWSSGFIGAELGTREAPADTLLMWRFIAATALLGGAWLLYRAIGARRSRLTRAARRTPLTRRALAEQAAIGTLSQGGYLGATVWSVGLGVPTGTAALIAALQPLAAGALAGRLLGETVTRRQWAGLVIGLAGVAMVVRDDMSTASTTPTWAYALPFAGMAALLGASFLERRAKAPLPAVDALPIHCLTSAALFSAVALAGGRGAPPEGGAFWAAVAWVVLLSTVGGYGFYWLSLSRRGVTRTSALMYLTPPTTAVWAYAMFGDRPGPLAVAGMAVSLAGVIAASVGGRRQRAGAGTIPSEPTRSVPNPAYLTSEKGTAKEPQSQTVR